MDIIPQPKTVIEFDVRLTEAEARAFLVDPAPFQRDLRAALAEHVPHTNGRKPLVLNSHRPRREGGQRPKDSAAPRGNRKPIERVRCENCKRLIGTTGLKRHLKACRRATADAAASSD